MTMVRLIEARAARLGASLDRVAAVAGIDPVGLREALETGDGLNGWEAMRLAHTLGLHPAQVAVAVGAVRGISVEVDCCSLRDRLAMAALREAGADASPADLARHAYVIADAMLAERLK